MISAIVQQLHDICLFRARVCGPGWAVGMSYPVARRSYHSCYNSHILTHINRTGDLWVKKQRSSVAALVESWPTNSIRNQLGFCTPLGKAVCVIHEMAPHDEVQVLNFEKKSKQRSDNRTCQRQSLMQGLLQIVRVTARCSLLVYK